VTIPKPDERSIQEPGRFDAHITGLERACARRRRIWNSSERRRAEIV
jgi:hypothetical protein